MAFKLQGSGQSIEQLERQAIHLLYLEKIKEINRLRRANKRYSKRQGEALSINPRTNANHKSDMAIMQNNIHIREVLEELETIDSKYNINFWKENKLMQEKNKKHLNEFRGE